MDAYLKGRPKIIKLSGNKTGETSQLWICLLFFGYNTNRMVYLYLYVYVYKLTITKM